MFETLKTVFQEGIDLNYGKLSLCDITHYNLKERKFKYQVHSDDSRFKFSRMYRSTELDAAIRKFMEIKDKVRQQAR